MMRLKSVAQLLKVGLELGSLDSLLLIYYEKSRRETEHFFR